MTKSTMIVIVVAVVVLAALGWLVRQRQRSEALRSQYGPEYDRALNEMGDKRRAEAELVKRRERVEQLDIRPLSAAQRDDYTGRCARSRRSSSTIRRAPSPTPTRSSRT